MTTILVTGAGGGGTNNLILGLRAIDPPVRIVGTNAEYNWAARSTSDVTYTVPRADKGAVYFDAINYIIEREGVDLLIPNNDTEAEVVAHDRSRVSTRTFLPSAEALATCRDKFALHSLLERAGLRVATTYVVEDLDRLDDYFDALGRPKRVWCRMRRGSGSRGSLPVSNATQARFWIEYWKENWDIPHTQFTLSEFLPGRDFACQSIWHEGELVITKTAERLEYLFGANMPSGTSSSPQFGRLVNDERVNEICTTVIPLVDAKPHSIFAMDLKEAEDGTPVVTEINAGRFFMITPAFNHSGRHNMADVYVRLALQGTHSVPEGDRFGDIGTEPTFLLRGPDQLPMLMTEGEMRRKILAAE